MCGPWHTTVLVIGVWWTLLAPNFSGTCSAGELCGIGEASRIACGDSVNTVFAVLRRSGVPDRRVVATLESFLSDRSTAERCEAASNLAKMGRAAAPAVPTLLSMFDDPDDFARAAAVYALGDIAGRQYMERLGKVLLKDLSSHVRASAAYALAAPSDREVVPYLVAALHDPDAEVRSAAVISLGQLGELASSAVPSLRAMLKDEGLRTQYITSDVGRCVPVLFDVIDALGAMGSAARSAVPDLHVLLEEKGDGVLQVETRLHAAAALIQIPGEAEPGAAVLREMLQHESANVREQTLDTLGMLDERAAPLADAMLACLKDPDPEVRSSAIYMVIDTEAIHERLVAALYDALRDPDSGIVAAAVSTLARVIDSADGAFLKAAFDASLKESDQVDTWTLRSHAAEAMKLTCGSDVAVSYLVSRFQQGTEDEQIAVVELIGWLELPVGYELHILQDLQPEAKHGADTAIQAQCEVLHSYVSKYLNVHPSRLNDSGEDAPPADGPPR
jgi:HEAT repeat protein